MSSNVEAKKPYLTRSSTIIVTNDDLPSFDQLVPVSQRQNKTMSSEEEDQLVIDIQTEDDNEDVVGKKNKMSVEQEKKKDQDLPFEEEEEDKDVVNGDMFAPYCNCQYPEGCVLRTCKKLGANNGKNFWVCGNKNQMLACSFFLWQDKEDLYFTAKARKSLHSLLRNKTIALSKLRSQTNLKDPIKRKRLDDSIEDYLISMSKYFLIHQ